MTSIKTLNPKLINQSEVARILGISQAYVHMIIAGKRKSNKYEKAIIDIVTKPRKRA